MWPRPILRTENNIKAIIHSCQLLGGRGWGTFQRCSFQLQKQKPYKAAKLYLAQAFRQLAAASPISRLFKAIKAAQASSETPEKNSTDSRVLPLVIYVTFQSKDTSDISAFIHQSNMFISAFIYPSV